MLQVVDECPNNAQLSINQDGYLTGDLQMTLPPIANVQLNPYTG